MGQRWDSRKHNPNLFVVLFMENIVLITVLFALPYGFGFDGNKKRAPPPAPPQLNKPILISFFTVARFLPPVPPQFCERSRCNKRLDEQTV